MQHLAAWTALLLSIIVSIILRLKDQNELRDVKNEIHELKQAVLLQNHRRMQLPVTKPNPNYPYVSKGRFLQIGNLVGDGVADDTRAIQRAINKATRGNRDATIILPKGNFLITKTLKVKAGVTLMGQGYGPSPLALDHSKGGSTIAHCGTGYAVAITGHSASVQNLGITDYDYGSAECANKQSQGGVSLYANGTGIESFTMRNVLIYKFMSGTSIKLEAVNAGGIAYASFENVRIRHAKQGIHLKADSTSFVNSNNFHDGAISGAITDIAVFAEGPGACNDNKFSGMVIEPPTTSITHVHVKGSKTNVKMNDVRLEGSTMPSERPLVIIEDDSYGNVMNGMLGHTFVKADFNRNPGITFKTGKFIGLEPTPHNLIWNAAFNGLNETLKVLPGWDVDGSNFDLSIVPDTTQAPIFANHNIMQVTHNGGTIKFKPMNIPSNTIHSMISFGIYAQSDVQGSISAAMKYESGSTIASASHTGSGKWEFISISAKYDKSGGHQAYFSITGNVKVTSPAFVYGSTTQVSPGAEFVSSSGGRMSGVLSLHAIEVTPQAGDKWVLPLEGNVFLIEQFASSGGSNCANSYNSVRRINDSSSVRFAKGSLITIMFPDCGGCIPCLAIRDNAYISLLGGVDFQPDATLGSGASLTLMSNGSGSWREVTRNGN